MEVANRVARRFVRHEAEPNEFLIQLRASAIRMGWSPREAAARAGINCNWTPPDVSVEASAALAGLPNRQCWRSRLR